MGTGAGIVAVGSSFLGFAFAFGLGLTIVGRTPLVVSFSRMSCACPSARPAGLRFAVSSGIGAGSGVTLGRTGVLLGLGLAREGLGRAGASLGRAGASLGRAGASEGLGLAGVLLGFAGAFVLRMLRMTPVGLGGSGAGTTGAGAGSGAPGGAGVTPAPSIACFLATGGAVSPFRLCRAAVKASAIATLGLVARGALAAAGGGGGGGGGDCGAEGAEGSV